MLILIVAILLSFAVGDMAAQTVPVAITNGESQADVVAKLDEPVGTMRSGRRTIWMYTKGTVEFENGKVVRSDFLSDDAYAKEQAKRAQMTEGCSCKGRPVSGASSSSASAGPVGCGGPGGNVDAFREAVHQAHIRECPVL
jgi:hypothetical protein